MSQASDKFIASFQEYMDSVDLSEAVSTATTIFVSLIVQLAKSQNADMSLPIQIDGGAERDITLHPPKEGN